MGHGTLLCTDQGEHQNLISSDCVDLQCHESTFLETSLFVLHMHKETSVNDQVAFMQLTSVPPQDFESSFSHLCSRGGKRPNQNHRDGW